MRAELAAVMRKELRQAFRDRRVVFVLIGAPILQLVLLGYAVDLDVDRIGTALCDQDRTAESRALVSALLADGTLRSVGEVSDPTEPLARGTAHAVLVLPRGFAQHLLHGRAAQVQVLLDGTDPIRAQVTLGTALAVLGQRSLELARLRLSAMAALQGVRPVWPAIRVEPRVLYNPRMKSPVYMVPGVAAITLLVVTTIVTAMGLAREKELGTIEQLLITPLRPSVLLLGKTLPFALIGLVVAGLVLAIGTHLFDVPVRGSLFTVFLGTVLYLMSTLGTGVFISTLAATQQQAILGGFFFLIPAILLSGFMSPIESMPTWIQPLTWVNPVRYYVEILRGALLKGASLADLWRPLAALLGFGAGILLLSTLRFHKRLG
ncbi:MAG: ABC transporter permease [Deltaproteobacteria bacterium]|nr:ABC transporter permease [Deltaproteobacteria bacterium]